jgi:adenylate kinase
MGMLPKNGLKGSPAKLAPLSPPRKGFHPKNAMNNYGRIRGAFDAVMAPIMHSAVIEQPADLREYIMGKLTDGVKDPTVRVESLCECTTLRQLNSEQAGELAELRAQVELMQERIDQLESEPEPQWNGGGMNITTSTEIKVPFPSAPLSSGPRRKIALVLGPPGSGKGTVAPTIVQTLGIAHLSTGDMLRQAVSAKTEVGKRADSLMRRGSLVTDGIVGGILKDRIMMEDCSGGFLLDGFPRNITQAQMLEKTLAQTGEVIWKIFALSVPDDVLEERICGRWIHESSGRSYHVNFKPPKSLAAGASPSSSNMIDDATGEPLIQRKDDTAECLRTRLYEYHAQTQPILDYFRQNTAEGVMCIVDATQKPSAIQGQVQGMLASADSPTETVHTYLSGVYERSVQQADNQEAKSYLAGAYTRAVEASV